MGGPRRRSSRCLSCGPGCERPAGHSSGPFLSPVAFEVTPVSAAWHLFASHLSSFYSHPLTATIPFPSPEQAAESGGAGSAAERPRGPEFQGLRVAPGRLVEVLHRDGCGGAAAPGEGRPPFAHPCAQALCGHHLVYCSFLFICLLGAGAFPGLFPRQLCFPSELNSLSASRSRGVGRRSSACASGCYIPAEGGGRLRAARVFAPTVGGATSSPSQETNRETFPANVASPRPSPLSQPETRVPAKPPPPGHREPASSTGGM